MSINLAKDILTGNCVKPNIFLCEVDKSIICKLETTNTKTSLKFNSYSEISFEVARIYNDLITGETKVFPFYDKIEALRLIKVDGIGYFEIQSAEINSDGIKESKSVTAYSLEYTLSQKYLEDLYNDGTIGSIDSNYIDDVYGGDLSGKEYPVITLYNPNNQKLSLLHIILEKAYGWTIGHVDTSLQTKSRQFNIDRTSIYDFIMNDICEMFNCYVVFDTVNNEINLYAEALTQTIKVTDDNITEFTLNPIYQQVKTVSNNGYKIIIDDIENKYNPSTGVLTLAKAPAKGDTLEVISEDMTPWETDVLVSFDNLSQEVSVNYNADDIKTVLTVEYGEGQNIREVNLGLPYITDLSYYNTEDWMGKELHDVYEEYNEDCNAKKKDYTDRVERRLEYAADLDYEENRVSLNYSVVRNVDSNTTTDETKGEVYYVRTGDAPNYTYVEKTLPGEYKAGTTYYRIGSSDLTEDKIVDFRKALAYYFKEDSMEELDKLVEAETFEFTINNSIPFGDKSYSDSKSLLHILNKYKDLGAKKKDADKRDPDDLYENMDIKSEGAEKRDTAIKNFLHEILDQFGLNMLNVVRDMYIKAQDGFIGGWNAADKANEDTSNNEDKELTEDQINAIKKEIQDSAEDYPEYYPIVLILEVLDAEIGKSIYSDPPSSTSTGRYADYTDKDGNIHLGIDNLTKKINKLIDENVEISNGLVLDNWFFNYYYKPLEDAFKEENNKDENYELTAEERMPLESQAKHLSNALLARLNPFLREDELTLEDIVSTELDGISESLSVQNDALSAAYLELQKLSQPQLSFSMSMANIFALPEFEPIIRQFKLGNLIKVAIRPGYVKQSRLLQIDMGLDDFSDFSCEFGELTNISSQSDIHADLLSNATSAGKQVATYSSYWTQGADTASTTDLKIQQGLLDATTKIKAIDGTQGVTIDKYGIKLQKIDPTTNAVDDKQAWFVNNSLLFTSDGWKTSRAGIGEFHADGKDFYGVIAEAIYSGYIEGTTIAGGKLYSTNYNPDPEKAAGTYINLETGDFEIGGKKLVYDSTDNKLTLDDVTINWNTSNAPGISDIEDLEDSITDFSKGISDNQTKLNNLDSSMAKYLGLSGNTIIGSNYVISPYIGGGYLNITGSKYRVIIDPQNKTNTGHLFQVHNVSANKTIMGIDSSGNAYLDGTIYANAGKIAGWDIVTDNGYKFLAAQYKIDGLWSSLKTNYDVFLSIGASTYTSAKDANAKIGHDGSAWFGRYNTGTISSPSYLYAFKVTVAGTIYDDEEQRDETRITMRGPVYTEAALFKQRIYLDNYTSLRGKNAGTTHTTNYDTNAANSQCIAYVSTSNNVIFGSSSNTAKTYIQSGDGIVLDSDTIVGGKLMLSSTKYLAYLDSGNIILGRHDNTNSIFIRSKNYIYLACNGSTLSESRYVFQICEYTNTASGNNDNQKSRGTFRPSRKTSEQYLSDLGSPNYKWNTVYAQNTVISSDKRSKENIENINEKYIEVFDLLQPVSYNFKERSRTHLGFISQDVENALNQLGMTAKDFAGFCRDIKTEKDKDGNEVTVVDENGNVDYIYGLNYTEFIALNTAKIKQLEQRLNQAIDIIDRQQEIIEELKNKVL